MDDMTAFEQQVARDALHDVGPVRPVDDAAIFSAITATQSPRWRFQSMFGAAKLVVTGAILALFGGLLLAGMMTQKPSQEPRPGVGTSAPSASPSAPSASPSAPSVSAEPVATDRRLLTVAGIPLSYELPASDDPRTRWESFEHELYIATSTVGSQEAEAMILWASFPDSQYAVPCLLAPSAGASVADLAAAVASAPGTDLVSGPSDVSVGGHPAMEVRLTVVPGTDSGAIADPGEPLGCDPAYFFGWDGFAGGPFWLKTRLGDSIRVWIVEVEGTLLVIEAETRPFAGAAAELQIESIVDSIRFE
jgi:hypothetical protein